jgi:hypothetical protein
LEERGALCRRVIAEGLDWEIMDPLTGDWWTPKLSLGEVIKINPQVVFRATLPPSTREVGS